MKTALLVALATLIAAPAAQAANPAQVVAGRLATMHSSQHTYPADAVTRASCTGVVGARQWRCKVTVSSARLLNGGEVWRYVATGRVVGQRVINFKAYAVGGIA